MKIQIKMSKAEKENLNFIGGAFLVIYLVVSFVAFVAGLGGSGMSYRCLSAPNRIERFFPSYQLGCFLGSKRGEKHYYGEGRRNE